MGEQEWKLVGQKVTNHPRQSVTDPPLRGWRVGDETERLIGNKHMAKLWWLETGLAAPLAAARG